MKKRYFWGAIFSERGTTLYRFRTMDERNKWESFHLEGEVLQATDPEVRRIQRRIAAGEEVSFPVEVTP